jgi:class 3 adenylate cyclase
MEWHTTEVKMGNLRTTVILKTDIVDFTRRTAGQTQSEMGLQRKQHKRFISEIAVKNDGMIFQEEGDAYLIEFPSVTTAALAAIEMHQSLRSMQTGKGEKQRLAIRAVIAVGDILYQENDRIGTAMSLTARIEKVTPPDAIYLSHAAWQVLNKAEVQTSIAGEFRLKGFTEPEKVYKVDQLYTTRVFTNQFIVYTDLSNWRAFIRVKTVEEIESFLLDYDDLLNEICEKYSGIVRSAAGDSYFLTFSEVNQALLAISELSTHWKSIIEKHNVGLKVGLHKGVVKVFRSYVYSEDIDTTASLIHIVNFLQAKRGPFIVLTTGKIYGDAKETSWKKNLRKLGKNQLTKLMDNSTYQAMIDEHGIYRFLLEGSLQK